MSVVRDSALPESSGLGIWALGRASLGYAFGGLAYKVVALVSVPIIARLLTPAQLGLLDISALLATLIGLSAVAGMDQGIPYLQARISRPIDAWAAGITVTTGLAAVLAIIGLWLREPIAVLLTGDAANGPVVAAASLYGGVTALSALGLLAIRLHASVRQYAAASFVLVAVEMSAALVVAWLVPNPVTWMIVAWAGGALVVTIPLLLRFLPRPGRPDWRHVVALLRFGVPLVPAGIAWLAGDAWIRSALARDASLAALGEYGIAHRVASVLGLGVAGIGVAWHPYLYRTVATEIGPRTTRVAAPLILVLAATGVTLTVLSPEVIALAAGPGYAGAREGVAALCAGMVSLGVFVLVTPIVARSGSTRRVALAAVAGAIIQVLAATQLVPELGVGGAGLASALGYTAAALGLAISASGVLAPPTLVQMAIAAGATTGGLAVAALALDLSLPSRVLIGLTFAVLAALLGRRLGPSDQGHPPVNAPA